MDDGTMIERSRRDREAAGPMAIANNREALAFILGRRMLKRIGLITRRMGLTTGRPTADGFEDDLDYVLEKNAELYRRLGR